MRLGAHEWDMRDANPGVGSGEDRGINRAGRTDARRIGQPAERYTSYIKLGAFHREVKRY